jgi:phosphoserine phosphatase
MVEPMRAAFFDLADGYRPPRFRRAIHELAARHRSAGDLLVLVLSQSRPSGQPGLETLGTADLGVGADLVLVLDPDAAWHAQQPPVTVIEAMALLGLDPARCFGYVDHPAGLGTLCVVGNPRVVGGDPELTEHAWSRGWPLLESEESAHHPGAPG